MTNLNLRKQKIKDGLIAHLVVFAFLLAILPIAIYLFIEWMDTTMYPYSKSGGTLIVWVICFFVFLIDFVPLLLIYIKFRKITFPTEEIHKVYCKKISRGLSGRQFVKIKTYKGSFIYIPPRNNEVSLAELCKAYQKQTLTLKCYAETKFIKEIKL